MRFTALPLPTGRFIVAACTRDGKLVMHCGHPVAMTRPGLNGQRGTYQWMLHTFPAAVYYTARDAENNARALSALPDEAIDFDSLALAAVPA